MIYLNAFLFCGAVCLLGQIVLDNTKLTPGHVTSMFVVAGVILAFFGLYEPIREWAGAGASLPITSFGDLLFNASYEGYEKMGVLGLFANLLTTTSAGITATVVFAFVLSLFSRPRE